MILGFNDKQIHFRCKISERKFKELLNMFLGGRSGPDVEQTGGGQPLDQPTDL